MAKPKWRKRRRREVAAKPSLPGVWATKDGSWEVRGRATNPQTGEQEEIDRFVQADSAVEAFNYLQTELQRIRQGPPADSPVQPAMTSFAGFATSLFEEKVIEGDISSAAGRRKWADVLAYHLIPAFGDRPMAELRYLDLKAWRLEQAKRVKARELGPRTVNTAISVLKVITKAATKDLSLDGDPGALLSPLSTIGHRTHTPEAPNSLKPQDVPRFLEAMRWSCPEHYAMTSLGFATGLRPSSLRPLRRTGPHPDILWDERVLLVRRSQTYGDEVMEATKTGTDGRIALDQDMIDLLREHIDALPEAVPAKALSSDLLFPSRTGGFRSRSVLDKPFAAAAAAIRLPYHISPKGMRRTFQDLSRAAGVSDLVTRSISGHQTEEMQHHYSTVRDDEQREDLAKITKLMFGKK